MQDDFPSADQSPEHGSENTTNITKVHHIGQGCLKVISKKKKKERLGRCQWRLGGHSGSGMGTGVGLQRKVLNFRNFRKNSYL